MYRLVASAGADAPKSTINADDEILTVLGGKASCRRKFVINVHLLDEAENIVNEEFSIVATVAYALDRSPIVQDDNLFLAEPPLLTTFNGVEYPSHDRPTRLVAGKASFKLAISLLSSKYDNRLFCICFTPQLSGSSPKFSDPDHSLPLCEPCYSKPIRSISRKRSSSAAPPSSISHHTLPQTDAVVSPPPKIKSPDSAASEEVEKFFRVNSATSSSEEEEKPNNCQNGGDAASDSGSLRYIASNSYKQEAQLLLRPDAIYGDPYHSAHHECFSTRKDPFTNIEGAHHEGFYMRKDPFIHIESAHHEGFSNPSIHVDTAHHHHHHHHDGFPTRKDPLIIIENGHHHFEGFSTSRKDPLILVESAHHHESLSTKKDSLIHVDHGGGCYMDTSGRSSKVDVLISGRFSPNPLISRSESTSPISGILTSDGSMEHADAFSKPSPITVAAATTERPISAPHPGSQLTSPFRPYNTSVRASRVPSTDFQRSSSRSPSYVNGLRRDSPEGLLMVGRPVSDQVVQAAVATSHSKKSLDAVLQRFLTEASSHTTGENSLSPDSNIENEEQSLLALELTLQEAIRELEKKKEELHNKRRRLLEDDEARMHNIVFQSSSWVENLSSRFNF